MDQGGDVTMRLLRMLMIGTALLVFLPGCSSGPFSDACYDAVDDFNDHEVHFDHVYYWYCQECGCREHVPFGNCY